ncbi:hypothetical protein EDB19DRAFT_1682717, partial [Suillus lakei]
MLQSLLYNRVMASLRTMIHTRTFSRHPFIRCHPVVLQSLRPSSARRFWNVIAPFRHRPQVDKSIPQERPKRRLLARHAHSNPPLRPATTKCNQPTPETKVQAGEEDEESQDADLPNCAPVGAYKERKDNNKRSEEPPADSQTPPLNDPAPPAELDSKL